jgi:hypothetical protein
MRAMVPVPFEVWALRTTHMQASNDFRRRRCEVMQKVDMLKTILVLCFALLLVRERVNVQISNVRPGQQRRTVPINITPIRMDVSFSAVLFITLAIVLRAAAINVCKFPA